jgi:hypothetical protein
MNTTSETVDLHHINPSISILQGQLLYHVKRRLTNRMICYFGVSGNQFELGGICSSYRIQ